MSLKSYFPEQFAQLKDFMVSSIEVVRCVRIDPEMQALFTKALAKMEDDPEFPHAFLHYGEPFKSQSQYFKGLHELFSNQYAQNAQAFSEQGISLQTPLKENELEKIPIRFLNNVETFSDSLPDHVGSLVFVLEPEDIANRDGYRMAIEFLVAHTRSQWLKFLVLDARTNPVIEPPSGNDKRIGFQTFHLSPEEIERRTKEDLASPAALQPAERRKYLGMLAGFSFGRKEYAEAEQLQHQWVKAAEADADPGELAAALYNLGNTLIAKETFSEAIDVYCKACNICLDNQLNSLAPLVYTNLGISLHRQGNVEQAFPAMNVARDMFKAQNHLPGEAYVSECLAQMYTDDGRNGEAEQSLLYALSLYEKVTSTLFKDLRKMGRDNILDKLETLYEKTGQKKKLKALKVGKGTYHGHR
jgi:tetratricopeptide (TPR) repeat protein